MTKLPLAFATLLSLAACTSTNPSFSADALYCAYEVAGVQSCVGYGQLSSPQKTAETDACKAESGKIVSSCPAGYVGCCKSTTAGYTTTECFYAGDAAELSQACAGTWSTNDGSKPDGGNVLEGPDACNQCSSPDVVCPKGCVDLQNDVKNCGSCGFACPAGADGTAAFCQAGVCSTVGNTCAQIVDCVATASTTNDVSTCISAGSALAQQQYNTAVACVSNACDSLPATAPDLGTSACGTQNDCYTCVQSGTTAGSCMNAEGVGVSDPLCGRCVAQVNACLGSAS
jgi:hypothetical protein